MIMLRMPGAIAYALWPLYPERIEIVTHKHPLVDLYSASIMELYPDGTSGACLFAFDDFDYTSNVAAADAMHDCIEMALDECIKQMN